MMTHKKENTMSKPSIPEGGTKPGVQQTNGNAPALPALSDPFDRPDQRLQSAEYDALSAELPAAVNGGLASAVPARMPDVDAMVRKTNERITKGGK